MGLTEHMISNFFFPASRRFQTPFRNTALCISVTFTSPPHSTIMRWEQQSRPARPPCPGVVMCPHITTCAKTDGRKIGTTCPCAWTVGCRAGVQSPGSNSRVPLTRRARRTRAAVGSPLHCSQSSCAKQGCAPSARLWSLARCQLGHGHHGSGPCPAAGSAMAITACASMLARQRRCW